MLFNLDITAYSQVFKTLKRPVVTKTKQKCHICSTMLCVFILMFCFNGDVFFFIFITSLQLLIDQRNKIVHERN